MIFTSNIKTIRTLTSKFIEVEKNEFDWTTEYINIDDNSKWLKVYLRTENHGGGYPILLRKNLLSADFLIKTILQSKNIEEISAGSALLEYFEKNDNQEFRLELIEQLEKYYYQEKFDWNEFEKKKLEAIVTNSSIFDDTNRRTIVGKNNSEINSDYDFLKKIALRAEKLINCS